MFCSRNLIQNYILNSAAFIGSVHTSYNLIIYTSIELNRIGLAEIRPQRGSYISKIDYAIVEESGFVRFVMETALVKRVCESITDAYLLALEQNIAQQKLCLISKDGDRFIEIDNEFHRLIFECAGKMWSYRFYRRTNGSL